VPLSGAETAPAGRAETKRTADRKQQTAADRALLQARMR
jgi:hypothetical protein